jgi:hypothetical protein
VRLKASSVAPVAVDSGLSPVEVDARVRKATSLIKTSDSLLVVEGSNIGLAIWWVGSIFLSRRS